MEVKPGYKHIDGKVIPNDWNLVPLASVTAPNVKNGIVDGPFGSNLKTIHYRNSGIPIITSGYVTDGKFHAEDYLYVDQAKFNEEKRSAVKPGDIVMAKIGERCGASAMLPVTHDLGILSGNALKITVDPQRYSAFYIWQVLWNLYCSGGVEALKTVGAQPAISMANLKKYKIALPSTKAEQEAIAEALSDADAFIESLEQLLDKKRQLKQGVMQELLTGKKRLPGFNHSGQQYRATKFGMMPMEWMTTPLERVAAFITKGSTPTTYGFAWESEGVLFLRSECVSERGLDLSQSMFISDKAHQVLRRSEVRAGDILMTITGNVGRVVRLGSDFNEANINQHIARIRIVESQVADTFVFHFLSQPLVRRYYSLITTGQAYPQISLTQVRETEVPMPSLLEQTAISAILSDMDAEIDALEAKLAKARQLKQGMMQELLTGRIRLIN
ncbi:MAG: restriction endonuclease subunit S [Nitrospira sp.]|nr:restriction endonuclease subunit S [Nitrospira sp.]